MERWGLCAWGIHEQHVSQWRFPPGEKVAEGGGAIKQHISPNAQLTKQTWQPVLYQPFPLLLAHRPLGWKREMHRVERYRSRLLGGSSALNHCLLFKGKRFSPQQRNSIKTTAFYSGNLCFTRSRIVILKITHKKNIVWAEWQSVWQPLTRSRRWGGHRRRSRCQMPGENAELGVI